MQFPKPTREAGHYQPSEEELEHGRAVADAEHRTRRKTAEQWAAAHREDLTRIEAKVDRELARLGGSDSTRKEIRKSMILAEIMGRVNASEPALAAAS